MLTPSLGEEVVQQLRRFDKQVVPKLLYFALQVDSGDEFGPLDKKAWKAINTKRAKSLGNPLGSLTWDREFEINWPQDGYYDLVDRRPTPQPSDRAVFTLVRFRKEVEASREILTIGICMC